MTKSTIIFTPYSNPDTLKARLEESLGQIVALQYILSVGLLVWWRVGYGTRTVIFRADEDSTVLFDEVQYYGSCMFSVQGRPGRQGFPGKTGPEGLKVRFY